jgi:DNA-directed RNA polymerase specialized sigma24 family protein
VETLSIPAQLTRQDELYQEASAGFGAALERMARGYEADPERRRDLLQEIHLAHWQSLAGFDGRCPCGPGFTAWLITLRLRM